MSSTEIIEAVSAVISTSNKLRDKKLDGHNYLMWRKVESKSLVGLGKGDHLITTKTVTDAKAWI